MMPPQKLTTPKSLTAKEKAILEFIQNYILEQAISPSYQEIKEHFGFSSFNSVQNYLKQLKTKGYISWNPNQKRSIEIIHGSFEFKTNQEARIVGLPPPESNSLRVPFMGHVAAGQPLEKIYADEYVDVPSFLVKSPGKTYALKVEGESMIEEGILSGDIILVEAGEKFANNFKNGDLVVATIDQESTVKRYFLRPYPYGNLQEIMVELRPSNPKMKSLWYSPEEVLVRGRVVSLFRSF